MKKEITQLKKKIEEAKKKQKELLVELALLKKRSLDEMKWEDGKKIEELKKQLLPHI